MVDFSLLQSLLWSSPAEEATASPRKTPKLKRQVRSNERFAFSPLLSVERCTSCFLALEMARRSSAIHPSDWTVVPSFAEQDFTSDDYRDSSNFHTLSKPGVGFFLPVITEPKIAEIHTNQVLEEDSQYEAPVAVLRSQPRPLPEPPTRPVSHRILPP